MPDVALRDGDYDAGARPRISNRYSCPAAVRANLPSRKVRHNIRDETFTGLHVVPSIAMDEQVDAGVLVLPDQIDGLTDTVPTKPGTAPRAASRSRVAATAAASRASSQRWTWVFSIVS